MVFNVIAFSSTLFAFLFGTAFNNLYRDVKDLERRNIHYIKDYFKTQLNQCKRKLGLVNATNKDKQEDRDSDRNSRENTMPNQNIALSESDNES